MNDHERFKNIFHIEACQPCKTLDKYIDYKKLNLAATLEELPEVLRLIITTVVDVMISKPLIFDNMKMEIKAKHILASSAYPIYGFPWVEVEDGVYMHRMVTYLAILL
jgi:NTE family protein